LTGMHKPSTTFIEFVFSEFQLFDWGFSHH
jgi:hypothetical protein